MGMPNLLPAIAFPLIGYLSGSLPFSIWITRLVKGVDLRELRFWPRDNHQHDPPSRIFSGRAGLHPGPRQRFHSDLAGMALWFGSTEPLCPSVLGHTHHCRLRCHRTLLARLCTISRRHGIGLRGRRTISSKPAIFSDIGRDFNCARLDHSSSRARQRLDRNHNRTRVMDFGSAWDRVLDRGRGGNRDRMPFPDRLESPLSRTLARP